MTAPTSISGQAAVTPDTPRVLLFGLPGGGKTALLGALARATEIQERVIGGRITDTSQGLRRLREHLYDHSKSSELAGPATYPIQIHPFVDGKVNESNRYDAVLIDCDSPDIVGMNGVAQQIFRADAVLFVLDASAGDEQVTKDCQQFREFLQRFRKERGRRTDEPNLPLWLVLAKCDRLARPGDNHAVWAERVEMRKEETTQQFGDVLKGGAGPSFGSLKFYAAATGVKQPTLTNLATREDEPFGVAELFRDVIPAAKSFREKRAHGEMNVRRLVMAASLVVTSAAAFAILTPILRNIWKPSAALSALTIYRHNEGTPPAGYLAEPIDARIDQLRSVTREPGFDRLSDADRTFVNGRLDELEQYKSFSASLKHMPAPAEAHGLDELKQIEQKLNKEAAVPTKFAEIWQQSDAGRTRERLSHQIETLQAAASQSLSEFNNKRQEFDQLFVTSAGKPNWAEWGQLSTTALNAAVPVVDASVSGFAEIEVGQKRYDAARQRLATFRDIAHSLAIIPGAGQTLVVNREFKVAQAPALRTALIKEHPKAVAWGSPDVPDAAMNDVKTAARAAYAKLLNSGRVALTTAFGSGTDGPESPARWRSVVEVVAGDPSMKAWNELARITLRLAGDNTDPLSELSAFLRRDDFPLEIHSIDLIQSQANPAERLTPTGSLTLFVQNAQGQVVKKPYRAPESVIGERIRFAAADNKPLTYHAGDLMWAEIGVTDASKADLQLTWWANGVRSRIYQFDRLNRSPRFHKIEQKADEGKLVETIRLELTPPNALPHVPDLMPGESSDR